MSKEAVRKEMSMVGRDRVKEEKEKENKRKEKEEREAAASSQRSLTRILSDLRQKKTKTERPASPNDERQTGQAKADRDVKKAGNDTKNVESIYFMWARYMNERDAEFRELRRQVTNLQEIVQKLGGMVTGHKSSNAEIKEKVATVEKEQMAASEALEIIINAIDKL